MPMFGTIGDVHIIQIAYQPKWFLPNAISRWVWVVPRAQAWQILHCRSTRSVPLLLVQRMLARRSMSPSSGMATGHRRPRDSHHSQSVWEFGLPAIPNNEPFALTVQTSNRKTASRGVGWGWCPAKPGYHGPQWLSYRPSIGRTPV